MIRGPISRKPINARSETARAKPSFRAANAARRCLIPADGFYEWKREGRAKQPWLSSMKDRGSFACADLRERCSVRAAFTIHCTEDTHPGTRLPGPCMPPGWRPDVHGIP